jgi:peptidoglycan/LPS O-acetylase OafA/YrhL
LAESENVPLTSVRGIAALGVFVAHVGVMFWPYLPRHLAIPLICGWMGVDLFFVLSGFILATVYVRLVPPDWGWFWIKRLLRVYPLNTAVMAFLIVCALGGIDSGADPDWPNLPWHLLALQSFVPHQKPGWFFTNWSVGVEMICYAAFPLLVLGLQRLNRAWLIVATLAAAAFTLEMQHLALASFWGLHAIMRCGSEFLLGAAAGTLVRRLPRLAKLPATGAEAAAVAAIFLGVAGGLHWDWCVAVGSWRMASVPVSVAVLIGALASDTGWLARALHARVLLWLGRVSFSLYMIHEPLLRRMAPLAWHFGRPSLPVIAAWGVLALAAALALATCTYRFIEVPGRRLFRLHTSLAGPPALSLRPEHGLPRPSTPNLQA